MTNSGKVAHAVAMKEAPFYFAWGTLPQDYIDKWNLGEVPPVSTSLISQVQMVRGTDVSDEVPLKGVEKVLSCVGHNGVIYELGIDFFFDVGEINWSLNQKKPLANESYTLTVRYFTEDIIGLEHELGRRKASLVTFCKPDPDGDIIATALIDGVPTVDARWSISQTPTRYLYCKFAMDGTEAVGSIIYQHGVYVHTQTDPSLPPGTQYFLPEQIVEDGILYMVSNVEPYPRSIGKREQFDFVFIY
jgi:hypothetical protein